MGTEITETIATLPRNETSFKISDSAQPDNSLMLKAVVGKYDYEIEGILLQDNMWNIHVTISDTYDFDEYRGNWFSSPLNIFNDIAYFGTEQGIVGEYDWSIDYYINKKDIWR